MIKATQSIQLIITAFLFSFAVASLIKLYDPRPWFLGIVISFTFWFLAGTRYFKLKNEMMKYKPTVTNL